MTSQVVDTVKMRSSRAIIIVELRATAGTGAARGVPLSSSASEAATLFAYFTSNTS